MIDDNNISDYIYAFQIFKTLEDKYNCKLSATTYVWVHTVNLDSLHCNIDQLIELRHNGWEIASHTMTHPIMTLLSEDEIEYELRESRDSLRRMGFNPTSFAFPCGVCDERLRTIAKKYYHSVRDTDDRKWNKPLDFMHLGSLVVPKNNSIDFVRRRINLALIRNEAYVILLFHRLGYGEKDVSPEAFKNITEMLIFEYNLFPSSLENVLNNY